MNPNEIDIMKLTPEDYLKMRDRCRELERDNILKQDHILELEHVTSELSATINRMHGGCERAIELRKLVDALFNIGRDEVVSDDEILRRMANLRDEVARLQKENIKLYKQRNQLKDEKKQQADCILKLVNELSQFRAAAKESVEKIEVLNDSISQLRNALTKEAEGTKYWADKAHQLQERISTMIYKGNSETSEAALKDADAKIQSANDRASNAKKEAKEAKERADNASERVRYLERKLRDTQNLNDALTKELARIQENLPHVVDNDADVYQKSVMRYAPSDFAHGSQRGFVYGVIGLCGEAGEASEIVKKHAFHGHILDYKHLAIELGDVLWYLAYTAYGLGYPLSKIMEINQQKLAKRYPDGKFDAERSRNREEGDI